jgi:hypothetical protein
VNSVLNVSLQEEGGHRALVNNVLNVSPQEEGGHRGL